MLKKSSILLFVFLLTACATAGSRIERTHLNDIKDGIQTKARIRSWFGEPYTVKTDLNRHPKSCTERWTYEYAEAKGFGTVTYSEILVVDFDAAGVVCDHAFSQTGGQ